MSSFSFFHVMCQRLVGRFRPAAIRDNVRRVAAICKCSYKWITPSTQFMLMPLSLSQSLLQSQSEPLPLSWPMRLLQTQNDEWEGQGLRPLTVATIVFALAEVAASVRESPEQPVPAHCPTECEYPWLNRFCWAKPYLFRAVALPVRSAVLCCAAIWPTAAQCRAEIMQNGKNGMQTWHKSIENLYVPPK